MIVVGGWSNDGVVDSNGINKSADRTEMLGRIDTEHVHRLTLTNHNWLKIRDMFFREKMW